MIKWYEDENLTIAFDRKPNVAMRYALPSMNAKEKQSIAKYPFINKHNLNVHIIYKNSHYYFTIPKDYCWDGATINRAFWRLIGSPTDNSFLISSMCHDVLCENPQYIDCNRQLSTEIFNALLVTSNVNPIKRFLMKHSVNIYQSFFKKWH